MKRIAMLIAGLLFATASVAAETPKTAATPTVKDKAMQQLEDQIAKAKPDKSKAGWRTTLTMPDTLVFDPAHTYYARMVTNKGTVLIKFLPQTAPVHVTSFAYLIKLGYFDGLAFHRVIPGFMAQGGCPLGTGGADPVARRQAHDLRRGGRGDGRAQDARGGGLAERPHQRAADDGQGHARGEVKK